MSFAQPFADYTILDRLGSGAMGTVFKARHKRMDRVVALKVLRPSLGRNEKYVERLRREAQIVAALNHRNIVAGYDLGREGGYHFFVMEYVEGKSLRDLLQEWGAFPEEQVLDVAEQVGAALEHAFTQGVIHRDIKPGNVLIDGDGHVKLADMGLAKGPTDMALTRHGATVGTPQYISPEQARDPQSVDVRSDLYSLGATLYHMATGQPPFRGEAMGEVITKVLQDNPPSAAAVNPQISDGLSLVIRKLMAKDPGLRYQDPSELLGDLERLRDHKAPMVDRRGLDAADKKPHRTRTRWWVAAAVLGTASLAAGTWVVVDGWSAGRGAPDPSVAAVELLLAEDGRSLKERWLAVAAARQTAGPEQMPLVQAVRQRLQQQIAAEVDRVVAAPLLQPDDVLMDRLVAPELWGDPQAFIRLEVAPTLQSATGFLPDELPEGVGLRLAKLVNRVERLGARRDSNFLIALEQRLVELAVEVGAALRDGRLGAARELVVAAGNEWLQQESFPEVSQLSEELQRGVREARVRFRQEQQGRVDAAAQQLAASVRESARVQADIVAAQLQQGVPPDRLASGLAAVRARLALDHPGPGEFPAEISPWPAIQQRLDGLARRIEAAAATRAAALEDVLLDTAWRAVLQGGDPGAVVQWLARMPVDRVLDPLRMAGNQRLLQAAADARRAVLGSLRRLAQPLRATALGRDGALSVVGNGLQLAGDPVGLHQLDLRALFLAIDWQPPPPAHLVGARVWLVLAGQPLQGEGSISPDVPEELWRELLPRIEAERQRLGADTPGLVTEQAYRERVVRAWAAARAAVEAAAGDGSDGPGLEAAVRGLAGALQEWRQRDPEAEQDPLRADASQWLADFRERQAFAARLAGAAPGAGVAVAEDYRAALTWDGPALDALAPPTTWRMVAGDGVGQVVSVLPEASAAERMRWPLQVGTTLPTPLSIGSASGRGDAVWGVEWDLAMGGGEQPCGAWVFRVGAAWLVVANLADGRLVVAGLAGPPGDRDEVLAALAEPMAERVLESDGPRIVPGAFRRLGFRARPGRRRHEVEVTLDGQQIWRGMVVPDRREQPGHGLMALGQAMVRGVRVRSQLF